MQTPSCSSQLSASVWLGPNSWRHPRLASCHMPMVPRDWEDWWPSVYSSLHWQSLLFLTRIHSPFTFCLPCVSWSWDWDLTTFSWKLLYPILIHGISQDNFQFISICIFIQQAEGSYSFIPGKEWYPGRLQLSIVATEKAFKYFVFWLFHTLKPPLLYGLVSFSIS